MSVARVARAAAAPARPYAPTMSDAETPGGSSADVGDELPPLVGLRAWRSEQWTPAAVDHVRETTFLDQYVEQAWRVHDVVAAALVARASDADDDERQLLFLRLFAEYVNALEVLGGWGWATRNRDDFKLLLDAFLGYAPGEVTSFYEVVASDEGDLAVLLALRPLADIARAWVERADENVRERDLLDEFTRCAANLRQAASQYFDREQLLVTNYNKAEHGAPIIRTAALSSDEFFVLAPQRDPTQSGRYLFSKFHANDELFARVARNITFVSRTTRAVVSLVRNLKALELL
jgi:hypothetical protein